MVTSEFERNIEHALGEPIEETRARPFNPRPATRLAVPIFHNGRWEYDIKRICDPEKAYREAIRVPWYERILRFLYR